MVLVPVGLCHLSAHYYQHFNTLSHVDFAGAKWDRYRIKVLTVRGRVFILLCSVDCPGSWLVTANIPEGHHSNGAKSDHPDYLEFPYAHMNVSTMQMLARTMLTC